MSINSYIGISLVLVLLDCTLITGWSVLANDFDIAPATMLGLRLVIDIFFVVSNLNKIKFNSFELIMFSWVLFCALIGLSKLLNHDEQFIFLRILKDTIPATLFFIKLAIFRIQLSQIQINLKQLIIISFFLSFFNIFIFYGLDGHNSSYVGLAPFIQPAVASVFYYSSITSFFFIILLIFLTGKRSYLISTIGLVFISFIWCLIPKINFSKLFFSRLVLCLMLCFVIGITIDNSIKEKMYLTFESLEKSRSDNISEKTTSSWLENKEVISDLNQATAGRSSEIFSILNTMTSVSWAFGHGAGFTYNLIIPNDEVVNNYSNSHLSPLGLTYKYGLPFALFFYYWLVKIVFLGPYGGKYQLFWRVVAILFFIQSFFAFNLFVEFLFPIALASLQINRK